MKFLIFHQYYDTPANWGSSRQYYFTEELMRAGHNVIIITGGKIRTGQTHGSMNGLVRLIVNTKQKKVISISDGYKQNKSFLKRILAFVNFSIIATAVSFRIKHVDVVFASSTPLSIAFPAMLFSKLKKVPMVFEVRDIWPEAPVALGYLKNKIIIKAAEYYEKSAYRQSKYIITLSKRMKHKIEAKTETEVFLITNSVDEDYFSLERSKLKEKNDLIQIVYAGSCGNNNAINILIEVINKLLKAPEVKDKIEIKIIGDGPALDLLKADLDSKVKIFGKIPKKEVIKELCKCDIALYPQRKITENDIKKDALPNKFFDYIGAGLVIAASIVEDGEAAVIIKNKNCGLVSEPEDVEKMYKNVVQLVLDNELREEMSRNSVKLSEKYKRSQHAIEFTKILERAGVK